MGENTVQKIRSNTTYQDKRKSMDWFVLTKKFCFLFYPVLACCGSKMVARNPA